MLTRLDANELLFANSLAGVSLPTAEFRESEQSWNILEVAEYVVDNEWTMSHFIGSAFEYEAPREREEFERSLTDGTRYRQRRLLSPGTSQPGHRFRFPGEALDRFFEARQSIRRHAAALTDEQLRSRGGLHPMAGDMSCYEGLLLIIADAALCAARIVELRRAHARSLLEDASQ
jgi:hypothetical protein